MKALLEVRGANPSSYKSLKMESQNQHDLGEKNYPRTLSAATHILQNYVGIKRVTDSRDTTFEDDEVEGARFLQSEKNTVKDTGGKFHASVPCHNCGDVWHWKSHCLKREMVDEGEMEGSNLFQVTDDRYLELSDSEEIGRHAWRQLPPGFLFDEQD